MIDTIGSGIKRMFEQQRSRFFPMPDYDLSEPEKVRVRITGKVLDENYTRALIAQADLSLWDVIALDRVQKRMVITEEQSRSLKDKGLIEGRRPKGLYVSAKIAALTGKKAEYIRNRGLDKQHYKQLVLNYLGKFGASPKSDIEKLLLDKLSAMLTGTQKRTWVRNLLQEMAHRDRTIKASGARRWAKWSLNKPERIELD
jgi:ATP-dependent DNA helicase RecG